MGIWPVSRFDAAHTFLSSGTGRLFLGGHTHLPNKGMRVSRQADVPPKIALAGSCQRLDCCCTLLLWCKVDACQDSGSWLIALVCALQWRDLPADAQLALTVWEVTVGLCGRQCKAGATFRLFSRKGRIKVSRHTLQMHAGQAADPGWPSQTPAKLPLAQRGELG